MNPKPTYTESADCRRVADYDAVERPGDFYFHPVEGMAGENHLHVTLPGGAFICIGVQQGGTCGPGVWTWDGNEERPTLTPSIHAIGRWHGYLTAGRLVSC